ncbi:MAG: diacylglycerol/lipid kinase family protein [Deltaproteobacteria bacterium]
MPKADYLLILNPTAGRGRAGRVAPRIESLLAAERASFEIRLTSKQGEATGIARRAAREGFPVIVAVGGDGTAHEVINGLVGEGSAFGMIPAGGGNDFPKAAAIPLELERAVKTLIEGKRRRVDLGFLEGRYFINGLGIGLDGAVAHRYRRIKRLRGKIGYIWGAIQEAFVFRGFEMEARTEAREFRCKALLAGASNGPSQGGDFKLAPDAKVDDGLLDFHVIEDMTTMRRLTQIPKALQGRHIGLREVTIERAKWMEIKLGEAAPAHLDGEPFMLSGGWRRIEVRERAIEVISAG